jgi:hypothetical protein
MKRGCTLKISTKVRLLAVGEAESEAVVLASAPLYSPPGAQIVCCFLQ